MTTKRTNRLEDTLAERFSELEDLADRDLQSALEQMIDMFEEVSNSFHHEIHDAIIMWVGKEGDLSTCRYLEKKITSVDDPYTREIFSEWISLLGLC